MSGTTNIVVIDSECRWVVINSSSIGEPPLVTLSSIDRREGDDWGVTLGRKHVIYDSRREKKFKKIKQRLVSPEIFCFKNRR